MTLTKIPKIFRNNSLEEGERRGCEKALEAVKRTVSPEEFAKIVEQLRESSKT